MLTYVYKHSHECALKDKLYFARPTIQQGVVLVIRPCCAETLMELELVEIKRDDENVY